MLPFWDLVLGLGVVLALGLGLEERRKSRVVVTDRRGKVEKEDIRIHMLAKCQVLRVVVEAVVVTVVYLGGGGLYIL